MGEALRAPGPTGIGLLSVVLRDLPRAERPVLPSCLALGLWVEELLGAQ